MSKSTISTFNKRNIRKVGDKWFTVDVVSSMGHIESKFKGDRVKPELHIDLAQSRFDKRDWIISTRDGLSLEQDGGFVESFSKRYTTITEMKQRLLEVANKYADQN